jgi:hypothetical protein
VTRISFLGLLLSLFFQPANSARGVLVKGPALKTSDGKLIHPTGDSATEGVLNDQRLLGMDMELLGHFESPDRFAVNPIHTRSIFVYKNGKRLVVTYWCDVCALRFYTPGKCWCCQQETELDLRDPDEKTQ